MPLALPSGFAEVTLVYSLTGDPEHMTVAFGIDAAASSSIENITSSFGDEWDGWMTQWAADYTLVAAEGRLNTAGTITEATEIYNTAGGAAAQTAPQNVALLVKKVTGIAGRKNRGRAYFPPGRLAEVDINNFGMIDAADVTTVQGELDAIYTALLADADIDGLVVLHTDPLDTPTPISSFQLEQQVATQRRRLRG